MVQFFVYNEDGEFLGIVMGSCRSYARKTAADQWPGEVIGWCRSAPMRGSDAL